MGHFVPGVDTVVSSVVGMSVPVPARMTDDAHAHAAFDPEDKCSLHFSVSSLSSLLRAKTHLLTLKGLKIHSQVTFQGLRTEECWQNNGFYIHRKYQGWSLRP